MKTLIVDDVKLSRDGFCSLLTSYFPEAEIIGSVPSVAAAREIVKANNIELIFLDIQLQDGIGFELLSDVSSDTKVVFITAYEQYAIEAIRQGAFDYLLKPVNVVELKNCIQRIHEASTFEIEEDESEDSVDIIPRVVQNRIGISSVEGIDYVNTTEIMYLKAFGKYTELCCLNSNHISSKHLKLFEDLLSPDLFMRVHHSYLVNLSLVKRFKKDDTMLVLNNGVEIPVSKAKKELLMKRLIVV